jgi:hypothetical protein
VRLREAFLFCCAPCLLSISLSMRAHVACRHTRHDAQAWGFADVYGSFAVRNISTARDAAPQPAMTQVRSNNSTQQHTMTTAATNDNNNNTLSCCLRWLVVPTVALVWCVVRPVGADGGWLAHTAIHPASRIQRTYRVGRGGCTIPGRYRPSNRLGSDQLPSSDAHRRLRVGWWGAGRHQHECGGASFAFSLISLSVSLCLCLFLSLAPSLRLHVSQHGVRALSGVCRPANVRLEQLQALINHSNPLDQFVRVCGGCGCVGPAVCFLLLFTAATQLARQASSSSSSLSRVCYRQQH